MRTICIQFLITLSFQISIAQEKVEKVLFASEIVCIGAIVAKNDPSVTKTMIGIGAVALNTIAGLLVVGK